MIGVDQRIEELGEINGIEGDDEKYRGDGESEKESEKAFQYADGGRMTDDGKFSSFVIRRSSRFGENQNAVVARVRDVQVSLGVERETRRQVE